MDEKEEKELAAIELFECGFDFTEKIGTHFILGTTQVHSKTTLLILNHQANMVTLSGTSIKIGHIRDGNFTNMECFSNESKTCSGIFASNLRGIRSQLTHKTLEFI